MQAQIIAHGWNSLDKALASSAALSYLAHGFLLPSTCRSPACSSQTSPSTWECQHALLAELTRILNLLVAGGVKLCQGGEAKILRA
eukprot:667417-Hanusia_phi.AAC.3